MKLVDIILPVYNAENFLGETLNSVVTQTYPLWRLWIMNDGSTDRSLEIAWNFGRVIGSFPGAYQRVNILNGPNQGVSAARNYAKDLIMQSNEGDYIFFIDSDDFWLPMRVWKSVYYLESHPEVDFLYSGVRCRFENGKDAFPNKALVQPPFFPPIYISTVALKKKCFSVGGFDSNLDSIEDYDLWCRIKDAGFRMEYFPEILTIYTVRSSGMAGMKTKEKEELFRQKRGGFEQ